MSTCYRCDRSSRNKIGPGWGGSRNITAPGQWFASRRVIRISRPGLSTNIVGVPSGIGFFKRISALGFRYIESVLPVMDVEGNSSTRRTHQEVLEMLIRLHPRLENALCVIDPAGISLQAEKHFARGLGTVHAERSRLSVERRKEDPKGRGAYNGALRVSRPARWSLWTWLRKQARGGGRAGLWRKKSTGDPGTW